MAHGISDDAITKVLDHMFGSTTYTKPTGKTLHLYQGDPYGAGSEVDVVVDDTAYAAQSISFANEGVTTNNRVYNDAIETFAATVYGSGAAPYSVDFWCVKDGSSNIMAAGPLPAAVSRVAGESLAFNVGSIYVELARTV
jgi:hypothetical protein